MASNKKRRLIIVLSIVFVALITVLSVGPAMFAVMSEVKSGYQFDVKPSSDGTYAVITGNDDNVEQDVEIKQITDPDKTPMDLSNVTYKVTENGTYQFAVQFTLEKVVHTEIISVQVDSVKKPEAPKPPAKQDDTKEAADNASSTASQTASQPESQTDSQTASQPDPDGQNSMTIGQLKELKRSSPKVTSIPIPMYNNDNVLMGNYNFYGGAIENIPDIRYNNLPYKFDKAEITLTEGVSQTNYIINYLDEVNGKLYYALQSGEGADFDIAYQVPEGAKISFRFVLNTTEVPVTFVNSKKGFDVKFDKVRIIV